MSQTFKVMFISKHQIFQFKQHVHARHARPVQNVHLVHKKRYILGCRIPYSTTMQGVRGPWPSLPKWEETKSKTICYQQHLQTPTVRGETKFETIAHQLILD